MSKKLYHKNKKNQGKTENQKMLIIEKIKNQL